MALKKSQIEAITRAHGTIPIIVYTSGKKGARKQQEAAAAELFRLMKEQGKTLTKEQMKTAPLTEIKGEAVLPVLEKERKAAKEGFPLRRTEPLERIVPGAPGTEGIVGKVPTPSGSAAGAIQFVPQGSLLAQIIAAQKKAGAAA